MVDEIEENRALVLRFAMLVLLPAWEMLPVPDTTFPPPGEACESGTTSTSVAAMERAAPLPRRRFGAISAIGIQVLRALFHARR